MHYLIKNNISTIFLHSQLLKPNPLPCLSPNLPLKVNGVAIVRPKLLRWSICHRSKNIFKDKI
ncbi:hypothetical protein LINPERPRIM_LOCUS5993 [Linum perenne]